MTKAADRRLRAEGYICVRDAADLCGRSMFWVRRRIKEWDLGTAQIGPALFVRYEEFYDLMVEEYPFVARLMGLPTLDEWQMGDY